MTMDAIGCQKKIAREIVAADADYVLALKGNQETMHEEMKTFLDQIVLEKHGPRHAWEPNCPKRLPPWPLGRQWPGLPTWGNRRG